jgi:hypothetical protein
MGIHGIHGSGGVGEPGWGARNFGSKTAIAIVAADQNKTTAIARRGGKTDRRPLLRVASRAAR